MTPVGGGGTWRSTRGQPHGQVARGFWGLGWRSAQRAACRYLGRVVPCCPRAHGASHQSTQNPITTENTAPAQATPFRLQPTSTSTSSSTSTSAKHRQPNLPRPPIATPPVSRRPSVRYTRTAHYRYRYRISPHLQTSSPAFWPLTPPPPASDPAACDPATNANESSRLPSLPLSQLALTLRPPSQPWLVTLEVPAQSRSASFLFLLRLATTCYRPHPPSLDPSPFGCFRRHIGARLPNPPTTPHHKSNHVHNHEPTSPRKLSWSSDNNLATSITDTSTLHPFSLDPISAPLS